MQLDRRTPGYLSGAVALQCGMPTLTARRYPERPDCWHIYYCDVRVGTIARRVGNPFDTDPWEWTCGFYPGSPPPRMHERHLRNVRSGPQRGPGGMGSVFIEANRGRLSGMARSAGLPAGHGSSV